MNSQNYQYRVSENGSSLRSGMVAGLVWMVAQFGISEALHQLGWHGYGDSFMTLSDVVAWPAGLIYHQAEVEVYTAELAKLEAAPDEREKWNSLLKEVADPDNFDAYEAVWLIFEERGLEPYVDTKTEYSIYIGVCVVWGVMVGMLVTAFLFIRKGL